MPIVCYRCSKCRREFEKRQEAEKCEAAHLTPLSVKVVSYTVRPYPFSVEIAFNDGSKRIYNAESFGG